MAGARNFCSFSPAGCKVSPLRSRRSLSLLRQSIGIIIVILNSIILNSSIPNSSILLSSDRSWKSSCNSYWRSSRKAVTPNQRSPWLPRMMGWVISPGVRHSTQKRTVVRRRKSIGKCPSESLWRCGVWQDSLTSWAGRFSRSSVCRRTDFITVEMENSTLFFFLFSFVSSFLSLLRCLQPHLMRALFPLTTQLGHWDPRISRAALSSLVRIAFLCGYGRLGVRAIRSAGLGADDLVSVTLTGSASTSPTPRDTSWDSFLEPTSPGSTSCGAERITMPVSDFLGQLGVKEMLMDNADWIIDDIAAQIRHMNNPVSRSSDAEITSGKISLTDPSVLHLSLPRSASPLDFILSSSWWDDDD